MVKVFSSIESMINCNIPTYKQKIELKRILNIQKDIIWEQIGDIINLYDKDKFNKSGTKLEDCFMFSIKVVKGE